MKIKKDNGKLDRNQKQIAKIAWKKQQYGLFLGAGSGKTRILLNIIFKYLKLRKKNNVLIVSTKASVLNTWPEQLQSQMQMLGLRYSWHVVHKEMKQRTVTGYNDKFSARIIICSYQQLNNILWHYDENYFDMIVVDESVKIKNWDSKSITPIVQAFGKQCKYRYILSGLPAPNKIQDLFSQIYLLDRGKRLGKKIGDFRDKYMQQSYSNQHVWLPKGSTVKQRRKTESKILKRIKDICVTEETENFVDGVPKEKHIQLTFDLPPKRREQYEDFARDAIIKIDEQDEPVTAVTAAALRGKLLQFVSGHIYKDLKPDQIRLKADKRPVKRTNKTRMKMLKTFFKEHWKGEQIIICYGFRHNIRDISSVIKNHFRHHEIFYAGGTASIKTLEKDWNNKRTKCVVAHAGSIGHSLNLQRNSGSLVFFSVTDNYDHYYQVIRRIKRRGNPESEVPIYTITCNNTADELVTSNLIAKSQLGKRVMTTNQLARKARKQVGL